MLVIATFLCGTRCEVRTATVVVTVEPEDLDDVLRRLAAHSCYYQSCPVGYADLIVADGRLVQCELLPESAGEDVKVLTLGEFTALWDEQDQLHREVAEELRQRKRMRRRKAVRKAR